MSNQEETYSISIHVL